MKHTIITALLALVAITSQAQIADTYWRNEQTGDWIIGFTQKHVIYNNKVWDITNKTEKKDTYILTIDDGTSIKVEKEKKGQRKISVGKQKLVECSLITTAALPDYPKKDLRTGFADNGYRDGDSVTIIGTALQQSIQKRDISKSASLKSSDEVANMSDGEQILRKLTEPYRGHLVLLDIWGTWCGPCKEALSHSKEEYERLKDYDLVYLYLANHSTDEAWKNVIKEYNVVGENIFHYNLPEGQQSAIERFLGVHAWPHYRLINRDGTVLDVNADPRDLEGLAKLLENLK